MEDLRIEKLEIKNIGPFADATFTFPEKKDKTKAEIHIFTGENGTGKSTILQVLASVYSHDFKNSKFKEFFKFSILFNDKHEFEMPHILGKNYTETVYELLNYFDYVKNGTFALNHHEEYDFAFFAYPGNRKFGTINNQSSHKKEINHPLQNSLNFYYEDNYNEFHNWIEDLLNQYANARLVSDILTANKYYKSIALIQNIIESICGLKVEFKMQYNPELKLVISIDNQTLDISVLPDGLKSMLSWISNLIMRMDRLKWKDDLEITKRRFILFLDEIDIHLHPAWQLKILPVVQEVFSNAQIFVSTHSPFVIGSVDGAYVHKLEKVNGFSVQVGEPFFTNDSFSYEYLLSEIFGVKSRFGEAIEKKLNSFSNLRTQILYAETPSPNDIEELKELKGFFEKEESPEISLMIGAEIRQLKKLLPHIEI